MAKKTSYMDPPKIILNAPTQMMKQLGYGKDYEYDHETEDAFSGQNYFPDELERQQFYEPQMRGFEREMHKRKSYFENLRKKRKKKS